MDIAPRGSGRSGDQRGAMSREKKALLKDQLELTKYKTADGRSRYTVKPLEGQLSFEKGSFMVVRAIQLLCKHNRDTVIVGLAGPSGSGKTAFSARLQSFIPDSVVLSMDMYNDGSKVIDGNFDDPRITDFETLLGNIEDLRAGRPTEVPIYDFKQSRRVGTRRVEVSDSRVVVLEGIYALSQRLRPLLDLRVSITGGVHFDLVKRVLRDISRSGQAAEEIIQQVSETVYPMYKAFIEPDLEQAQLRVYNSFNPFSGFMSPTFILKSSKRTSERAVEAVLAARSEGGAVEFEASESYDIYLLPPNEDPESCASWLRMRYRDGRYTLMFEEWVVDGNVIISPRVTFEVPVRILGGLMALGYDVGTIMRRTSRAYSVDGLTIKLDEIEGMDKTFVQIQSKRREDATAAGAELGLDGTYVPHSYIELVQMENLTAAFQTVTEDLKRRFRVNGEPLEASSLSRGSSPLTQDSFRRTLGFELSGVSPQLLFSSSAPVSADKAHDMARFAARRSPLSKSNGASGPDGTPPGGEGLLRQHMAGRRRAGDRRDSRSASSSSSSSASALSAAPSAAAEAADAGPGTGAARAAPRTRTGLETPKLVGAHRPGAAGAAAASGPRPIPHVGRAGSAQNLQALRGSPAGSGADLEDRLDMLMSSQMLLGRQLEEVALQLKLLRESQEAVRDGKTINAVPAREATLDRNGVSDTGKAVQERATSSPLIDWQRPGFQLAAIFSTAAGGALLGSGIALLALQRR
ncbi:hypothetical protein QBZ16_002679 [Prototheca wickerhamii]|uniref:CYTH domain-containing protein n=1 Tax=Prototheca wickerhamii TaxID=3111 RepID=A0AAD9MHR7_PROWI|nr:hypothetical protein QBZ16_002679 [Prototheca wickerhamii]